MMAIIIIATNPCPMIKATTQNGTIMNSKQGSVGFLVLVATIMGAMVISG